MTFADEQAVCFRHRKTAHIIGVGIGADLDPLAVIITRNGVPWSVCDEPRGEGRGDS